MVIVSPDGVLHGLPLAALPGKKAGSYLVDEYLISYLLAPQLLLEVFVRSWNDPKVPALLCVGDIDFGISSHRWGRLPGTAAEIDAIRKKYDQGFPNGKVKVLKGLEATKAAFCAETSRHQYLHLATHGFFLPGEDLRPSERPDQPARGLDFLRISQPQTDWHPGLLAGLVFAGANETPLVTARPAYLSAMEASELALKSCELVVLSACDTGLGRLERSEGFLSMQRAFQVAGAKATITSLWKVPDRATQELMASTTISGRGE